MNTDRPGCGGTHGGARLCAKPSTLSLFSVFICVHLCFSAFAADLGLMQNFDGDLSFTGATPEASRQKLEELIDDVARGSRVKSVAWSIGAGSDILYYPTRAASTWGWRTTKYSEQPAWKTRIEKARLATEAGLDAPRIAGERAKHHGMKFFPSYRMNDGHFVSDPLEYPLTGRFWMEHQHATIGRSPVAGYEGYKHLLNFARPQVRAYRMAVIHEAIDRYADVMDGLELDFNRFQIFFPPGEAEGSAHLITEMVQQVRTRLDEAAAKQGRPMTLIVRVAPAMHNCRWSGLEVGEWMKRRLVDVVIPAQVMTLSHDMPLDGFVAASPGPGTVQVFGSVYGRAGYSWPFTANHGEAAYATEVGRTPTAEQVRGAAMNMRQLGAEGFQLYNFGLMRADEALMTQVWRDLAAPGEIPGYDRRYQVTPAYFHDREDSYEYRKQLPLPLVPGKAAAVRLLIGEDLAAASPRPSYVGLRLGLFGANQKYDGTHLRVVVNSSLLHDGPADRFLAVTRGKRHGNGSHPPPTEAYVQWPIRDLRLLKPGWNALTVTLKPAGQAGKQPAQQLVEAEVGVIVR